MAASMDIRYTRTLHFLCSKTFICMCFQRGHIAGIGSIFITGFLPGICSKFLAGILPKFLAHIPGKIPARNLNQIPGRIPANLNISLQIPQGVQTDSCRNLYKKNQRVKVIPVKNMDSFSCGNTAVFLLDNFIRVRHLFAKFVVFHEECSPGTHALEKRALCITSRIQ